MCSLYRLGIGFLDKLQSCHRRTLLLKLFAVWRTYQRIWSVQHGVPALKQF